MEIVGIASKVCDTLSANLQCYFDTLSQSIILEYVTKFSFMRKIAIQISSCISMPVYGSVNFCCTDIYRYIDEVIVVVHSSRGYTLYFVVLKLLCCCCCK